MATKDSFDAFLSIIKDKIGEFFEHTDEITHTSFSG